MIHSTEIDKIAEALVALGAEITNPHNTAVNPFHKNKYAPLNDMLNDLRPLLSKHGLAVSQIVTGGQGDIGIETVILHESGQYISAVAVMAVADEKGKSPAQAAGSTISYLRRYAIAAALNIASEDDDDGNTGLRPSSPPKNTSAPKIPEALTTELHDLLSVLKAETAEHYRDRGKRIYLAGNREAFKGLIAEVKTYLEGTDE